MSNRGLHTHKTLTSYVTMSVLRLLTGSHHTSFILFCPLLSQFPLRWPSSLQCLTLRSHSPCLVFVLPQITGDFRLVSLPWAHHLMNHRHRRRHHLLLLKPSCLRTHHQSPLLSPLDPSIPPTTMPSLTPRPAQLFGLFVTLSHPLKG